MENVTNLVGPRVYLRPVQEKDFQQLFSWRNDLEFLFLWSHPRRLVSMPEYISYLEKAFNSFIDVFLMIVRTEDEASIGFIYNYDTNRTDGYSFLSIFLEPGSRHDGIGGEAGFLFLDYLFAYFPFRKIYADIFEFNHASAGFAQTYQLNKEGYFPEHRWFNGQYWGMFRYALYQKDWGDVRKKVISKMGSKITSTARMNGRT